MSWRRQAFIGREDKSRHVVVSSVLFERDSDFSWASVFSWRSRSVRAGPESQIPQRPRRVLWQQWKCKTQTHMCLDCRDGIKRGNKIAENLFISEPRQLYAVRFCLVLISSVDCLPSLFVLVIDLLSSLFIHLSLFCMHVLSFSFFSFMWSLHSPVLAAVAAAAFVW